MNCREKFPRATLRPSLLSDIAPIFNLIQSGAMEGVFSNLYLIPRYQAGLGLQLLSCLYLKCIKLPDGIWHRAEMKSAWVGSEFAGFSIVRHVGNDPVRLEIYLCALVPEYRGRGIGKALVAAAVDSVPFDGSIEASCLDDAIGMKALLRKAGFVPIATPHSTTMQIAPETFLFYPCHANNYFAKNSEWRNAI